MAAAATRDALDDDARFDALYPLSIRLSSARFWTPIAIARRAAEIFRARGVRRVLDVGSGAGKLAIVAACAAPDILFEGVEHRPRLVAAARRVARRLMVENVHFRVGDATDVSWEGFDGVYLFNPFAENLWPREARIDQRVALGPARFAHEVDRVERALRDARPGTCVVTYNGIGCPIPGTYDLAVVEHAGTEDTLRTWIKSTRPDAGSCVVDP